jgi:hypothetical protein
MRSGSRTKKLLGAGRCGPGSSVETGSSHRFSNVRRRRQSEAASEGVRRFSEPYVHQVSFLNDFSNGHSTKFVSVGENLTFRGAGRVEFGPGFFYSSLPFLSGNDLLVGFHQTRERRRFSRAM